VQRLRVPGGRCRTFLARRCPGVTAAAGVGWNSALHTQPEELVAREPWLHTPEPVARSVDAMATLDPQTEVKVLQPCLAMRAPTKHEPGALRMGMTHIAFSLGSEDQVYELTRTMHQMGAPVLDELHRTNDGYDESVVLDPDGNRIELSV
jgi:catechol 2,3-dioxygenase-like lactoylglutathione lyase family enzyme